MSLYTHAGSTEREIRDRFKKLALKWHPDKNLHDPDEAQKVSAVSDQTALARMKPEHSPLTRFGYSVETPPPTYSTNCFVSQFIGSALGRFISHY